MERQVTSFKDLHPRFFGWLQFQQAAAAYHDSAFFWQVFLHNCSERAAWFHRVEERNVLDWIKPGFRNTWQPGDKRKVSEVLLS
jgi:hypothetical protein